MDSCLHCDISDLNFSRDGVMLLHEILSSNTLCLNYITGRYNLVVYCTDSKLLTQLTF
jgi:hypothetical protein